MSKLAAGAAKSPVKSVKFIPVRASYDAASRSPEAARHWRGADALSADAALAPDVRRLIISRSRYEVANNGYASGILNTLAEDAVGTGPRLQLYLCDCGDDEDLLEKWEARLERREKRWKQWAKIVGLRRKLKIARRTKAQDGEVFIKKSFNPGLKGHVKLDLTLFESEQVGSPCLSLTPDFHANGVPQEVDGIVFDENGNPKSYRFWRIHPGSSGIGNALVGDSCEEKAENVIHYANIIRPGQHRGISEISSTLPIFNDLRRFTNAVLAAAEIAAEISFVMSTDTPAEDSDGNTGAARLDAGTVLEICRNAGIALPEGWKASQLKAEQPTVNHTEFLRTKIREASRAVSMPMNVALGDSSGYNYASGRLDHQTYHRTTRGERAEMEEVILDDVLTEFESIDMLFYPDDYDAAVEVDHDWMWDGGEHVDPVKEANAQNIRLNQSRVTSMQEECAREGKDYAKVMRQQAREYRMRKKLGLPVENQTQTIPHGDENDEKDE